MRYAVELETIGIAPRRWMIVEAEHARIDENNGGLLFYQGEPRRIVAAFARGHWVRMSSDDSRPDRTEDDSHITGSSSVAAR